MALINDPTDNRARPLRAYHLFGRSAEKVDSPVDVPMAPLDPEALVERGKGRVRFGGKRLKIYKGESLGFSLPAAG